MPKVCNPVFGNSIVLALLLVALAGFRANTEAPKVEKKLMDVRYSKPRPQDAKIDMVVLHFSSDVIANPDDPYNVDRLIKVYADSNSSAHYLIDRDGKIYLLVDEGRQAFHAGKGKLPWEPNREDKLNESSVGIEMMAIGSKDDMTKRMKLMSPAAYDDYQKKHPQHIGFTEAQYKSLNQLLDDIRSRHSDIKKDRKHVIGHDDYAPDRRSDPGELFDWSKIGLDRKP